MRIKRLKPLAEASQNSGGMEVGEAVRIEIWVLVNGYILKAEKFSKFDGYMEEKIKELPNVEKLLAINGVELSTIIAFIAEVGDIGRFIEAKQIQKVAGSEIVKKSYSKKKGNARSNKRGKRKVRKIMYESACARMTWSIEFQEMLLYYRGMGRKLLREMQVNKAVVCKAIRVFYVVLKTDCDFDEGKFRNGIFILETI